MFIIAAVMLYCLDKSIACALSLLITKQYVFM